MSKPTDFVFDSSRIRWNTPEDKAAFEASGSDWATEAADKLYQRFFPDLSQEQPISEKGRYDELVLALRKAKADGMQEAATLIDCGCETYKGVGYCADPANCSRKEAKELRAAADKIEHPLAHNDDLG